MDYTLTLTNNTTHVSTTIQRKVHIIPPQPVYPDPKFELYPHFPKDELGQERLTFNAEMPWYRFDFLVDSVMTVPNVDVSRYEDIIFSSLGEGQYRIEGRYPRQWVYFKASSNDNPDLGRKFYSREFHMEVKQTSLDGVGNIRYNESLGEDDNIHQVISIVFPKEETTAKITVRADLNRDSEFVSLKPTLLNYPLPDWMIEFPSASEITPLQQTDSIYLGLQPNDGDKPREWIAEFFLRGTREDGSTMDDDLVMKFIIIQDYQHPTIPEPIPEYDEYYDYWPDTEKSGLYYNFEDVDIPDSLEPGEYTYTLTDMDGNVVATGLSRIGDLKHKQDTYETQQETIQYRG